MGGILFPVIPILVAWPRWRVLPKPLRWAVAYLVLTLVEDLVMIYWSRNGQHNLWIMNLYTPIEAGIFGMMFGGWQLRERWRGTIYVAVGGFMAFWIVMMATIEGFDSFSRFTKPVESLLVITAAAWTLVQRARHTAAPLTRHPWFWVSVGTLFYFAYLLLLDPISTILGEGRMDLLKLAYELNGALVVIMYLFWMRAITLVRIPSKAESSE
jgi:hypothetical protein